MTIQEDRSNLETFTEIQNSLNAQKMTYEAIIDPAEEPQLKVMTHKVIQTIRTESRLQDETSRPNTAFLVKQYLVCI